ncbi:hypothetical protein FA95DRAFT_1612965 [Auriscalpium vulgare]|uniref:Uncharacterized protein n=1 Tax=Auriscalpium vulgare TaxID=40419 RepID=A0ACB8R518_9AGAM|nr:hypothetical protein FA95DRAFT_1612965 [Auriscalpium vulgare]
MPSNILALVLLELDLEELGFGFVVRHAQWQTVVRGIPTLPTPAPSRPTVVRTIKLKLKLADNADRASLATMDESVRLIQGMAHLYGSSELM